LHLFLRFVKTGLVVPKFQFAIAGGLDVLVYDDGSVTFGRDASRAWILYAVNRTFVGWHSRNLRLVNCKISGTQPLCYAHDLIIENCTMADDADLAFEYSSLQATIKGPVHSIKNPRTGSITAESYGAVIIGA